MSLGLPNGLQDSLVPRDSPTLISQGIVKTLVTGGTGFLGSHLVRVLLERGEEVRCLTRRASRLDNLTDLPAEVVTGDLRDLDSLRKAAKRCRVIYHCAADYRLYGLALHLASANGDEGTVAADFSNFNTAGAIAAPPNVAP